MEDKDLIVREIDENNRRQNKISLTPKGKEIMKKGIEILKKWEKEVFNNDIIDDRTFKNVLKEIAINAIELNEGE